jgi:hypothetical protein
MARELETGGLIETRTAPIVKDAVEAFLSDARAGGLRESSIYKLKLLTTRLKGILRKQRTELYFGLQRGASCGVP